MPDRSQKLRSLQSVFDVLVVGGGATGLGMQSMLRREDTARHL